jgi:hypothetical protein
MFSMCTRCGTPVPQPQDIRFFVTETCPGIPITCDCLFDGAQANIDEINTKISEILATTLNFPPNCLPFHLYEPNFHEVMPRCQYVLDTERLTAEIWKTIEREFYENHKFYEDTIKYEKKLAGLREKYSNDLTQVPKKYVKWTALALIDLFESIHR